ncbi:MULTISPECIES: class I SAM-dependent methyltransferase [unclassified Variovorax]|uniref:class I SAM-dependent methyltransferase n=1 Tax=unclassified Variovorax TaxID=663243 RepID=UPI00076C021C|nr:MULTISPECIES: class I SAM-dependent methyltransferase [unclassified Variovorax]KWT98256.1 hypothetical protein APY03_0927 [Variovorax sp. WDL1]PNG50240.1 hypothetical protein CHC06_05863 [Variovorax sp. B2]PNG51113.1 hypothetical protein CHC07_05769 [Variovorax sp. B4]VTU42459.1 3-demethylubiquinone-9 3-O-methyltransferase [Variovorax sp. SRS16]VTU42485.1 3-demethylubiquinone-9 3-O-methyltransferase [Variovorax sp. PBL-E5]
MAAQDAEDVDGADQGREVRDAGDATDELRRELVDPIVQGLLCYDPTGSRDVTSIQAALQRWEGLCDQATSAELTPEKMWTYKDWPSNKRHDRVLDLGCGDAVIGHKLMNAPNVAAYVGVDKESERLKAAQPSKFMQVLVRNLEEDDPFGFIDTKEMPNIILAIRLFDHIADPAKLLLALGQLFEPGREGIMLVATSNRRYFKKDLGPEDFSTEKQDEPSLTECRDGLHRHLRSRTAMRRHFRDAGFHVFDEASPLLPASIDRLKGFTKRNGDHAVAPFHIWLLGIYSTRRIQASRKDIDKWVAELAAARRSLGPEENPGPAHLLLSAISDDILPGVHWRTVAVNHPIAYKHNTAGQVFIVESGRFGAYLPGTEPSPALTVSAEPRVVFDPNEVFGELEVFNQDREHDRRYVASVYAMPGEDKAAKFYNVLVLPVKPTVQALMGVATVLGNPMLQDLRTKSLESNLRYHAQYNGVERFSFTSPTGVTTTVRPAFVIVVASLLALALEADREKGLYSLDGRRVVYIDRIDLAAERLLRRSGFKDANAINGALKYLQAAGIIGVLRPVPDVAAERVAAAARLELAASELYGVRKATANVPGSKEVFDGFIRNSYICMVLVEREMALRKFLLEPTQALFDETTRGIAAQDPASAETQEYWRAEMDKVSMQFWKRRIEVGAWAYDSLGFPLSKFAGAKRPARVQ